MEDCNDPARRELFRGIVKQAAGLPPAMQAAAAIIAAEDAIPAVA
jgi:hypothetical protein